MNDTALAAGSVAVVICALVGAGMVTGLVATPTVQGLDDGSVGNTTTTATEPTGEESTTTADTIGGGNDRDTDDAETTTSTTTSGSGTDHPFAFTIDRVEECGSTCRDVTVTLTNQQDVGATNVTVTSRIWAGNSTDGDPIWTGTEDVGRLPAGDSYTATKRVELSFTEAYAVEQADGWITLQTTIETDDRTISFTEHRNVG